ncbi:hypothetical protein ABZP36_019199 [Zizania latifolia]
MPFLRGGGGGASGAGGMASELQKRHFSRKRAVDVRRINPKAPKEEAVVISGRLLQILTDHGPLTVGNTWNNNKMRFLCELLYVFLMLPCWYQRPEQQDSREDLTGMSPYSEDSEKPEEVSPEPSKMTCSQGGKAMKRIAARHIILYCYACGISLLLFP